MRVGIGIGTVISFFGCSQPQAQAPDSVGNASASKSTDFPVSSGWPAGSSPTTAIGLRVNIYASGLDHPSVVYVLPNGDVLVAESDPARTAAPETGLLAWIEKKWKGTSAEPPIRGHRITLLRDADKDGVSDVRTEFLAQQDATDGIALVGNDLYVATGDKVLRFGYRTGSTKIVSSTGRIAAPTGTATDGFRFRNLVSNRDGNRLYATASPAKSGTKKLVGEVANGTVLEIDPSTGKIRDLGNDLGSPVGLAWGPGGKAIWTSVVEKMDDETAISPPTSLMSLDTTKGRRCVYCRFAPPDDRRTIHAASPGRTVVEMPGMEPVDPVMTGLAASDGTRTTDRFAAGMFVDRHRPGRSGSEVVFVPFLDGSPSADPIVVMSDFVTIHGVVRGRPAGIAIDSHGDLLVADDLAGLVWRLTDIAPDDHRQEIPGKSLRARTHDTGDRK